MVRLLGVVAVNADDVHREARDSTRMSKEAILLVAFGSTAVETQRVFDHIEVQVKQDLGRYPDPLGLYLPGCPRQTGQDR